MVVKAIGQVAKGLLLCETNAVSFLPSAGANFVFHFSSGMRTIRTWKAILPGGDVHQIIIRPQTKSAEVNENRHSGMK